MFCAPSQASSAMSNGEGHGRQLSSLTEFCSCLSQPGGERTIGLGSTLFRIWQRMRGGLIRTWQEYHHVVWDRATKGNSALAAAYRRAIIAETGAVRGLEVATCLWDLQAFFCTIRIESLIACALELGYPARF